MKIESDCCIAIKWVSLGGSEFPSVNRLYDYLSRILIEAIFFMSRRRFDKKDRQTMAAGSQTHKFCLEHTTTSYLYIVYGCVPATVQS